MTAKAPQQVIDELKMRINVLSQYNLANVMSDTRGSKFGMRNSAQVLSAMGAYVATLKNDVPIEKITLDGVIDSKL